MTLASILAGGAVLRYRSGQANIVCDGNSLAAGTGATVSYPSALAGLSPLAENSTPVVNIGIPSQTAADMQSGTIDLASAHATGKQNILVAWELTNSIYFGRTPTQAVDDLMSYIATAKTLKSWNSVIVVNTIPRYQTTSGGATAAQYNTYLLEANVLLAQRYREQATILVDLRASGSPFAFSDFAQATFTASGLYNADNIHCNNAGYLVVAQYVAQALRRVRL